MNPQKKYPIFFLSTLESAIFDRNQNLLTLGLLVFYFSFAARIKKNMHTNQTSVMQFLNKRLREKMGVRDL